MANKIAFIDLEAQQAVMAEKIDGAISKVLSHGKYILGPEVGELETKLGDFCGAKNVITCGNGTDALTLVLMAEGVGPGHVVFVPSFTFVATAEAVAQLGATPFFVDVDEDTYNIDIESLTRAIREVEESELSLKAVIAVDLFGLPADYDALQVLCKTNNMILIADSAQSFGALYNDIRVGVLADYTTTSFFPAKPLGCYGDGGAIFTGNDEKAVILRSLRFHGKGADKYDNVRIGLNSRLDTIQAAILLEKLEIFEDELERRQEIAYKYNAALEPFCKVPKVGQSSRSAWAQYTIQVDSRDGMAASLEKNGIPTAIYYPITLNKQTGYSHFPKVSTGLSASERLSQHVLSLPMHPYLEKTQQDYIINNLVKVIKGQG